MKKFFTLCFFALSVGMFISGSVNAQDVYWREGFDQSTTDMPSSSTDTRLLTGYWATLPSGSWYFFGAYRTTGTSCVNYGTGHLRTLSTSQGLVSPDSAKVVTSILDFGVSEVHFSRCRAQRGYGIYYRTDTSAASPTGWTLIKNVDRSPNTSSDTAILVNLPTARRIMITGDIDNALNNSNQDFDSIWVVSSVPIVPNPVKFNGINANYANGMVKVLWSNETEVNIMKYEIERSVDARNFAAVGSVNGANTRQYSFFDYSPAAGTNFYRIKGIDRDGSATYSSVVKISTTKGTKNVVVMPNPVKGGKLNLQVTDFERGTYNVSVYNNAGQKLYATKIVNEAGSSTKTIVLPSTITTGMYKLQVEGANTNITKSVYVD